ncbi:ABC transporter ATP-binding protein [Caproiciproducens galactitolivorans]|uniref:Daunorubicin/doxorubicin resistance ATP-binding protein DrrA n=1 Tax=Caproiciproducens galactitolivorans TaxID=642589 RepID=A0A4Z0YF49_9FIRM|nr:ABC transporter ATP-binding protein [Caproiciproducens galactitolivorans]QEY34292.1 ABC transporter ATP-binding protein [Caproiciproducens galactitolivorans]TGJ77945.1 daunorubicin/doxorubicin resistance ATP-binding protein DrrA [Caproiciproducens galactitolivorans]
MAAIHMENLTKTYDGKITALNGLSLDIPQGGIFGFLGPNGAGKTTTVKLLTGLLKPTKGTCTVFDMSPMERPCDVHRICGVMTETARMYGQMTGRQNLQFFAQAAGMDRQEGDQRADELLKSLDLWDARDRKLSEYSTGMAQRLSLARSLVHRPRVLFLDEPTSGLDPESAQTVNAMILSLARNAGVTVFLCTHQLRYAQDLCDAYGILERGNLLAAGDLPTLCKSIGCRITAEFRLAQGQAPKGFQKAGEWWRTEVRSDEEMPGLVRKLIDSGHDLYEARLVRPTLEDVYFQYTQRREVEQ